MRFFEKSKKGERTRFLLFGKRILSVAPLAHYLKKIGVFRDCNAKLRLGREIRILYITDYVLEAGGCETRLIKQFKWLASHGHRCFFLTTQANHCPALKRFHCLNLSLNEPNFADRLVSIVKDLSITHVEFICKGLRHYLLADISRLRCHSAVGLLIVNNLDFSKVRFSEFDYVIRGIPPMQKNFLESVTWIKNWIQTEESCWKYAGQKVALNFPPI